MENRIILLGRGECMNKGGYVRLFLLPNANLPFKIVSKTGYVSEFPEGLNRNFWNSPPEIQSSSGTYISIQILKRF